MTFSSRIALAYHSRRRQSRRSKKSTNSAALFAVYEDFFSLILHKLSSRYTSWSAMASRSNETDGRMFLQARRRGFEVTKTAQSSIVNGMSDRVQIAFQNTVRTNALVDAFIHPSGVLEARSRSLVDNAPSATLLQRHARHLETKSTKRSSADVSARNGFATTEDSQKSSPTSYKWDPLVSRPTLFSSFHDEYKQELKLPTEITLETNVL
ncbi:Hypothetical predicted protein [Lecanosticta acicola]|uniref:Uncharacterized protein n=1 Tax=Lecanosticta acicola TaxID=111012 RepID=A0AAI8Z8Z1_9PEZI|nr:Hypothetical predicted protein [Lecanosticta acicola]